MLKILKMLKPHHAVAMTVLALAGTCLAQAPAASQPAAPATQGQLKDGDFVAVCGDSITEQRIYSRIIAGYLLMCQPAPDLRAMQAGWSGEWANGFQGRLATDVLPLKPTVATTCYGMNDGGYKAFTESTGAGYRTAQTAIVKKFKEAGVRLIIIGSPGVVDRDTFHGGGNASVVYNETLAKLGDIDRQIAAEEGVVFADLHTPMMDVMIKAKAKYGMIYNVCGGDGVHPNYNGHTIMAYAFLKAMGCDGNIGAITLDLASARAEATAGHEVTSAAAGSATIKSTRYPFCFFGDAKDPSSAKAILEFLPFNADLNRLTLIVKGANADAAYHVTWGEKSRDFTGEVLAKGINLAAEFPDNPFSDAFKKVDAAVGQLQGYETPLTKELLHNIRPYQSALKDDPATVDALLAKLIARDKTLADAARAAVVPVTHTIKVEAAK